MYINPATFVPALSAGNFLWGQNGTGAGAHSLYNGPAAGPRRLLANGIDIAQLFHDTANAAFPPRSWLGFGLDMTTVTPVDITSVAGSVLTHSRVIKLKDGGERQELSGVSWVVPPGVNVNEDVRGGHSDFSKFASGEEAARAIGVDSSLAARYMAVSGGVSASYAVKKTFQRNYQYGLFAYNQVLIHVELEDFAAAVDENLLLHRLSRIDKFDSQKTEIIQQYKSLFSTIGTHIITGANYGGRLQLTAWADNSDSTVNQDFSADLGVEFNGLTTSGKVDVDVRGSSQFRTFEQSIQKTSSCMGGDPDLSASIASNPQAESVFDTFQNWVKSADGKPNVMSFATMTLWDLMAAANSPAIARRARDVYRAYQWLVEHPEQHVTRARLVITSNWGEVGLLTPSAYIVKDEGQPDVPGLTISRTKVSWDSPQGAAERALTVDFVIVNDGSPVDIELSHGSGGSAPGKGEVSVQFNEKSYRNAEVKDNNWNTVNYYGCPVNPHGRVTRHHDHENANVTATA